MAVRALFVAALLLAGVFAGCLGGKDEPVAVKKTTAANNTTFVKPDGRGGDFSAFQETNKTETTGIGASMHDHDYWKGRTRVTLFDLTTPMEPNPDDSNEAYRVFHVPLPSATNDGVVYEGTGSVDFTISDPKRHACIGPAGSFGGPDDHFCSDSPAAGAGPHVDQGAVTDPTGGPSGLKLRYKHASTNTWLDAGELTWGTPLKIKITDAKQTDMPHSTASGWAFEVVSSSPADTTLIFRAKAEIVRGDGSIPPWPAHPLFYADTHVREVCRDCPAVAGEGATAPPEAGPYSPKRLVSWGTHTIYVWANITDLQTPNPATAPTTWWLSFTNTSGQFNGTDPFDNTNHSADKKSHLWILSVNDGGMDSPYSDSSKWTFDLRGALTTPVITCYSGCADYTVKYTLTILATDLKDDNAAWYKFD